MNDPKTNYAEYLATDYWKAVVQAVKERAGYRCQLCNSQHDLQAHHRCYDHRGKELEHLGDLTCLCRRCHGIFHGVVPAVSQISRSALARPHAMVLITEENYKRLRPSKEPWHCEVKGPHAWDDSIVKLKVAAAQFPWCAFWLASKDQNNGTGWRIERVMA